MSLAELKACLESRKDELSVLDVRERDAFEAGAVALDGGMKVWREAGYAVKAGKEP